MPISKDGLGVHARALPAVDQTAYAAAIFDLDGTLVNSEGRYLRATRAALAERGSHWQTSEVSRMLYGRSWFDVFRSIDARAPGLFQSVRDLIHGIETQMKADKTLESSQIYSSVRLLSCLAKHIPVSIVSGSSRAQVLSAAAAMDVVDQVTYCLGFEDYEKGKPSPSGFIEAARRMDVAASSCVVFEDSAVGVAAARRAGMFCIALARPDAPDQDLSYAHLVVSDLCDEAVFEALS